MEEKAKEVIKDALMQSSEEYGFAGYILVYIREFKDSPGNNENDLSNLLNHLIEELE